MATLNGRDINTTYPGLIKTNDESAIDGTLKTLQDGVGNDLPLQVSTSNVKFTGNVNIADATFTASSTSEQLYVNELGTGNIELGMDNLTGSPVTPIDIIAGSGITLTRNSGNEFEIAAAGGGGGGFTPLPAISNQNYGMQWSFYDPAGGPGAYGRRIIGYSVYLPAGDYDQFSHWVQTAATTAGAVYDLAVYNTDKTVWGSNGACSFKPTTMVTNALATGIDATSTGQRLITLASPFTSVGDWYFFGFRFDNGVDNQMEGKYAGVDGNEEVAHFISPSVGGPTPYQFASTQLDVDALIVGDGTGPYTSMPTDLTSETSLGNTSYRVAFSAVAQ